MTDISPPAEAVAEVVTLASELIAIDTTNLADPDRPGTERPAAEYVAAKLAEVGYETTYVESGAPGRGNVIARLDGADPSRGALLIHGHLDVVPADPADWTVHPFSGEVRDGYLWGRGAVDMKGMVAMTLAVARQLKRDGIVPPRDLIFAFVADEEAAGLLGARWLVDHRPELFDGATEAISEVGGFSVTLDGGSRAYLVQTAEKSSVWLRLIAHGTAGHGSMLHTDNAVAKLAAAITRLDEHRFPLILTEPVRELLTGVAEVTGVPFDPDDPEAAVARLGDLSRFIGATLRDTANVTMVDAGYKANVVPSVARATVDGRTLPGPRGGVRGGDRRDPRRRRGPPVGQPARGADHVRRRPGGRDDRGDHGRRHGARLLPYMMPAATDAKSFDRLGIRHFGFSPLRLPADLDFTALFHGVDERVPTDALEFGTRVLHRLMLSC